MPARLRRQSIIIAIKRYSLLKFAYITRVLVAFMKQFLSQLFFGKPEYNKPLRQSAYTGHWQNIRKIWNNEKHHDIGFEKVLRLFLVNIEIIFPGIHVRHYFGKFGLIKRNVAVEFYVLFKTLLPLFFLATGLYQQMWAVLISSYLLMETIFYVSSLIFVSDMFVKPRSYRRNILMLFLNYMEISFGFAVIYGGLHILGDKPIHYFDYIYFSIVTATTIGYGDLHPVNITGKVMVCSQAVLVLAFILLFLNFFGSKVETLQNDDD
jgi:ion channel